MAWLQHLPADAALNREREPDGVVWDLHAHLLAGVFDVLRQANWQRAGDKHATKPKPLPRPGVKDAAVHYGKTDLPPEQAQAILDAYSRGDYAPKEATDG